MSFISKQRKVFSFLLVFVLVTFVTCFFVKVKAYDNGIGTVNQTYSRTIIPGVTYTYTESSNGDPQKNYVLEYNPKDAGIEALAVYGQYAFGGDTLSKNIALAESRNYTVIAGVNGSPFDTSNGTTTGTLISQGRIISSNSGLSGYDSFAIKDDGSMFIGTSNLTFKYKINGGTEINIDTINKQKKTDNSKVYLYTNDYYSDTTSLADSTEIILSVVSGEASIGGTMVAKVDSIFEKTKRTMIADGKIAIVGKDLKSLGNPQVGDELTFEFINNDTTYEWEKVEHSVNGFYEILKDGEYVNTGDPAVHPRTTIGFKADGTIVLYVVDGRQPTFSVGLTDLACAQYMKSLGCVGAIRMDGGGSSTMAIRMPGDNDLTTVNSPSDGQERNDADGLLLVLKSDYDQTVGSDTLLHAYPNNVTLLEGTVLDIDVKATDERYNAKPTPEYEMSVVGDCGSINENGKFQAKKGVGEGQVKFSYGSSDAYVNVKVTNEVDELYATVNNLALSPNEEVKINVKAYYKDSLLTCSNESFEWSCTPEIGTIGSDGVFKATSGAGVSGEIVVKHGNVSFKVKVTVGQLPVEITGFEDDICGTGAGQWRNNQVNEGSGSCSINADLKYVRYGKRSLRIDFNLAGTTATCGTQISTGALLGIPGTPTAIGMWVYATPSAQGAWIRMQYQQTGSTGAMYADFGTVDWTGWKYLEAPIDASVKYPVSVRYLIRIMAVSPEQRIDGTIYVDQLRAVYGFTNDDFDAPEISNLTPGENGVTDTTTQTVSFDITDTGSGINKDATEFYLDNQKIDNILFKEINDGYTVSWTPSSIIPLTEGSHKIKVRIEDNYNNYLVKEWKINVDTNVPVFKLEGNEEADLNKENELVLKTNSIYVRDVNMELSFDPTKVAINDILVHQNFDLIEKVIDNENGKVTIKVKCFYPEEKEGNVLVFKYQALTEGEVDFKVDSFEYVCNKYPKGLLKKNLGTLSVQAISKFDYEKFVDLVNAIDLNNVLNTIEQLREAYKMAAMIDTNETLTEDVTAAIEKLNSAALKYNEILAFVEQMKETSINSLFGGK